MSFRIIAFRVPKDLYTSVPDDDNSLTEDGRVILLQRRIKIEGMTWTFHKNDKDPFPSIPHGHNYEKGEKLNVSTGEVIDRNKNIDRKLSSKKMIYIQRVLREDGFMS